METNEIIKFLYDESINYVQEIRNILSDSRIKMEINKIKEKQILFDLEGLEINLEALLDVAALEKCNS